jgi:ATP-dependent DNA ligase
MIAFSGKSVMYPPRPDGSTHPDTLSQYPGWWGQRKFNGTRTLVFFHEDGTIALWNRHKEQHRAFQMGNAMRDSLDDLKRKCKKGKIYVFDGELMHSKTKNLKNRIILWDILVYESEYMIGSTYEERYNLLCKLLKNPSKHETITGKSLALEINNNIWLAEVFKEDLLARFKEALSSDEIEGLVLKNPSGKLDFGIKESNNGSWQIRVRKPNKNYEF